MDAIPDIVFKLNSSGAGFLVLLNIGADMPRSAFRGLGVLFTGLVLVAVAPAASAQQQQLDQSVKTQRMIVTNAAAAQQTINKLSSQTQRLLNRYLMVEQQLRQLKKYNANLQQLITNQQSRIKSLNEQMGHISDVEHGIVPLMEQMIAGLKNFIKLDVPYRLKQREREAQKLEDEMGNSDVSVAEKYRLITSAYQRELQAGRTIAAYRGSLEVNGKTQTVDFLRIGRVVLCYQTLDQSQTGCWDQRTRRWVVENGFRAAVVQGLQVARKQTSPKMLILPVSAPQQAQAGQSAQ